MGTLGRHLLFGCLARAAALSGVGATLGTIIGLIEEGNRAAAAGAADTSWLASLARVPEVLFFASPLVALLAVLWTARDLVPEPVAEGLAGAGVRGRRIDAALAGACVVVALAAAALGGWLAPWAQRESAADPSTAWARSGGVPEWTAAGWTWVRTGGRLVRIEVAPDGVRAARALEFGPGGPRETPLGGSSAGLAIPTAAELGLLAAPPAFLTFPDLLEAAAVRERFGHLAAPVLSELALRAAVAVLAFPAAAVGLACRRIRLRGRRWWLVALLALASLLGLQASHVWATRGELPIAAVVAVPLAAALAVAALAWVVASRRQ
ncbi:MAG: hypothetical protein HY905_12085 [Deltaproteobacteria bacterium]|nr:hypothetical protein [Deltaproteobacteria bacterium]